MTRPKRPSARPERERHPASGHVAREPRRDAPRASGEGSRCARPPSPAPAHAPRPLPFVPATPSAATLAHVGCTPLFQPLGDVARSLLAALPDALDTVMPLSSAHRRDLPYAVNELSTLLTSERGGLSLPYWSSPRLMSAYLRYFLPWNLIRLARLIPGIALPKPEPEDLIVDFGSGPLTMPLALWLARPGWRDLPLSILAVDTSGQVLEAGRSLFRALVPDCPWKIRTLRAPLHKALREVRGRARIITAVNMLNEVAERGPERRSGEESPLAERMSELTGEFARLLVPGGTLCCVEPGTRLGGTLISYVRAGALEADLVPRSPCPHDSVCPLEGGRGPGGWCHAGLDSSDAPEWLRSLAVAAGLGKHSLSLSHFVASAADPGAATTSAEKGSHAPDKGTPARVLSDAFAVPGLGLARYACTAKGLALIPAAASVPQGALVTVRPANPPRRDAKSGARVMVLC